LRRVTLTRCGKRRVPSQRGAPCHSGRSRLGVARLNRVKPGNLLSPNVCHARESTERIPHGNRVRPCVSLMLETRDFFPSGFTGKISGNRNAILEHVGTPFVCSERAARAAQSTRTRLGGRGGGLLAQGRDDALRYAGAMQVERSRLERGISAHRSPIRSPSTARSCLWKFGQVSASEHVAIDKCRVVAGSEASGQRDNGTAGVHSETG